MYPSTNRLGAGLGERVIQSLGALVQAPLLIALGSGALAVLAFAPFGVYPLAPLALAGLCEALYRGTPGDGFRRGLAFGIGLLGLGVAWIRISLGEFGNMDAWIADLATLLFVGFLALFYGAAGWLVRRLDSPPGMTLPLLLLPGTYVLLEWLRGWVLTGFPWLSLGSSQIDGPLSGYAPLAGVYGVSLLVALSGGLLWGLVRWGARGRVGAAIALAVIWSGGAALRHADWTEPQGEPFEATVIQANIPQSLKWDPGALVRNLEIYLDLTRGKLGSRLIVWPETAVPAFLHQVREGLVDNLTRTAREQGGEIVLGIPVMDEDGRYFNGLLAIGSDEDLYLKRHLVPFGEFMPLKSWVGPIARLFEVPMSDFSRGDGDRPLLAVGPYLAGASICYEDAFPGEVSQALPEAQFLINVSNDGWFGDSLAPHQHLEMARMRALENGRALVRATNTGISAILDHRGLVLGSLPHDRRDTLTHWVQPRSGATPFVRLGNGLAIALAAALSLGAVLLGRLARRPVGGR